MRVWVGGSPATDRAQQGVQRCWGGRRHPCRQMCPSAHVLPASSMGCGDHPMKDRREQERCLHQGSLEVPVRRNCTCIYICIYLFNCSWASPSCALCAGVCDSSLFLCRENIKTSEKGQVGSLHNFTPLLPASSVLYRYHRLLLHVREDQSNCLFYEISENNRTEK